MKHIITFLLLCSLYSFVISLTSCEVNGQSALQRETETKPTSAQTCQSTCSSPQIADNIFEIFEDDQGTIWFGTD
ncbi:MAG: two-component regulator propeller domain-containing protein, partial [Flavobacteriales bacterium]